MRKIWFIFFLSLFIISCGYKPVQKYANHLFENPVLVKVKLDPEDPESGEYLEYEASKMVVNRLNLTLTDNVDEAKGYILINNYTINTTPANKDDDGNVIRYSINAAIEFAVKDKYGFWSKNIVANEYVSVKAQSTLSSIDRQRASRLAIKKSLDEFLFAIVDRANNFYKNGATKSNQDGALESKGREFEVSTNTTPVNGERVW
jgi:hypothetical protein